LEKILLTFLKKVEKNRLPSPHLAAMNSEFTAAWRREGVGVFIMTAQRHRLVLTTGAKSKGSAPVKGTNRCLCPRHALAPVIA